MFSCNVKHTQNVASAEREIYLPQGFRGKCRLEEPPGRVKN